MLLALFGDVAQEDLRYRFLPSADGLGHETFLRMLANARLGVENWLALDADGEPVAIAMLAASGARGEIAVLVRADCKGQGIGWTLLGHLVARARDRGYLSVESIEDRDNRAAIMLDGSMGVIVEPVPDDPRLVHARRMLL